MSFVFRIHFSGLCAFVFDSPVKEPPDANGEVLPLQNKEGIVLLQNLIQSRRLSPDPNDLDETPQFLDSHYPQLEFNMADLDPANTRIPDLENKITGRGLCLLFGEDLTLLPDRRAAQPSSLSVPRMIPKDPQDPTPPEQGSLWWMATMDDAFPGKGILRQGLEDVAPNEKGEIVARVQITQGDLSTTDRSTQPCTFESPGSKTFKQRIATQITLEIPITTNIGIRMVKNSGVAHARELVLFPSDGKQVEIVVGNLEIDGFLGLPKGYQVRSAADFEVHYELSAAYERDVPTAFPLARTADDAYDTRNGGLCPPTAFVVGSGGPGG